MHILGDPWLLSLGAYGNDAKAVAGTLLKAQTLLYNHRGHVLDLGTEYVRRSLRASARMGQIPQVYARCSRCGCLAMLPQWVATAHPSSAAVVLAGIQSTLDHPEDYLYLQPCNGSQVAMDTAVVLGVADELR